MEHWATDTSLLVMWGSHKIFLPPVSYLFNGELCWRSDFSDSHILTGDFWLKKKKNPNSQLQGLIEKYPHEVREMNIKYHFLSFLMSKLLKVRPGLRMSSTPSITRPGGSLISGATRCLPQTSGREPWLGLCLMLCGASFPAVRLPAREGEGGALTTVSYKSFRLQGSGQSSHSGVYILGLTSYGPVIAPKPP